MSIHAGFAHPLSESDPKDPPTDQLRLISDFRPMGDQPQAIEALVSGLEHGEKYQTLLGATGTGKTFTMANVIERTQRPTLIISHNKTLAAQLYEEMKELFPDNKVCFFVSYYDYYQPEAYIPQRDIYIEKDASRNDDLDRLRLSATSSLVSRRDVIIVASVSAIYGLGSPDNYKKSVISIRSGQMISRRDFFRALSDLQYQRSDLDLKRGTFRVRGDVTEIYPADEEFAYRVELFGDEVDTIQFIHPLTGELLADEKQIFIYPAVHYVMPEEDMQRCLQDIEEEMSRSVAEFKNEGKLLEAQRLKARTKYDLEMIQEVGYCSGIENYSRHLEGRPAGSAPYTLLDYFPDDYLLLIDESHVTLPQLRAMYNGDQARKGVLVEHGFRLPSALDNRPLMFEEIEKKMGQTVFVSATPGPYELEVCEGTVVEQIIRPTGLLDPMIEVRPASGQVPDLLKIAAERTFKKERTIVTTLTKRLAEQLTTFLDDQGLKCRYLHSDIDTLDRVEILRALREGDFDVLIGVNLLREGLDLPEVSLVAIMDADKTGFLRSATSLIQQIGRAARNQNAMVILYADEITEAMQQAMDETARRRERQVAYNKANKITPRTVKKSIRRGIEMELRARKTAHEVLNAKEEDFDQAEWIHELETEMLKAAENLEFEKAARLRDQVAEFKNAPDIGKTEIKASKKKSAKARPKKAGELPPGAPGSRANKGKYRRKDT